MKSNLGKQRGFTLVKMAIVVVLGGILLAAGLVAGRGLISRSKTQDVLQIVGDLQAASNSFTRATAICRATGCLRPTKYRVSLSAEMGMD